MLVQEVHNSNLRVETNFTDSFNTVMFHLVPHNFCGQYSAIIIISYNRHSTYEYVY
jgi:hypothetical protein